MASRMESSLKKFHEQNSSNNNFIMNRYDIEDEPSGGNEGDDEDEEDDDDDDLIVDDDPSSSLVGLASDPLSMVDVPINDYGQSARQKLATIQARMKNFETILVHIRCQLSEMNKKDNEILKRLASLNDEIAEMNLLESYESSRSMTSGTTSSVTAATNVDNYSDLVTDYGHVGTYHMMKKVNPNY